MRNFLAALLVIGLLLNGPAGATVLGSSPITTAVTNQISPKVIPGLGKLQSLSLIVTFNYVSGGTSAKVYVQTTLDGVRWYDIASFAFTTAGAVKSAHITMGTGVTTATPTTGTLADNTVQQGVMGDQIRYVITSVGTYGAGTTVEVDYQVH